MKATLTATFLTAAASLLAMGCQPADEDGSTAPADSATTADTYPLKVCVVSGEALGSMGDPISIQHDGKTVKFCCESCVDDFKKEPATYMAKLAEAAAK